ncbi:MAG: hypothetical protein KBE09_03905 [Candidatus Pacebacteria bacterium]|nr:hypothetical protein [Candidatus Paceibacterota bacterium]
MVVKILSSWPVAAALAFVLGLGFHSEATVAGLSLSAAAKALAVLYALWLAHKIGSALYRNAKAKMDRQASFKRRDEL